MKQNKKRTFTLVFLLVMAGVFLFDSAPASASDNILDVAIDWWSAKAGITNAPAKIIAYAAIFARKLAGIFLTMSLGLMDIVTSKEFYDRVLLEGQIDAAITLAWTLVRDFINMFFIIILVFLAVCIILQVPGYSDKKLVAKVLFAALLVNFSKPIAIFFLDASQLAMNFFLVNIDGMNSYGSAFADKTQLDMLYSNADTFGKLMNIALLAVVEAIFTTILAVMIGTLAVSLFIRVIAFWILIILSPLAFLGFSSLSFLSGMKTEWIKKITYWSFYGPVLLFFLWLSLFLLSSLTSQFGSNNFFDVFNGFEISGSGFKTFLANLTQMVVPFVAAIYLLFYGYDYAKSFASSASNSTLNAVMGAGDKYAKIGGKAAGKIAAAPAYLGYKAAKAEKETLKSRYEGLKEGVSEGLQERGGALAKLTKAGREKEQKQIKDHWKGKGGGYVGQGQAVKASIQHTNANELVDKWKKPGQAPSIKELQNMVIDKKNPVKAIAAAQYLAEKDLLNTVSRKEVTGKDPDTGKGESKDINLLFEASQISNTSENFKEGLAAKVKKKDAVTFFNNKFRQEAEKKFEEAVKGKTEQEGNRTVYVEDYIEDGAKKDAFYKKELGKMNKKQLAELNDDFYTAPEFKIFISNSKFVTDPEHRKEFVTNLSSNKLQTLEDDGLL